MHGKWTLRMRCQNMRPTLSHCRTFVHIYYLLLLLFETYLRTTEQPTDRCRFAKTANNSGRLSCIIIIIGRFRIDVCRVIVMNIHTHAQHMVVSMVWAVQTGKQVRAKRFRILHITTRYIIFTHCTYVPAMSQWAMGLCPWLVHRIAFDV